MVFHEENISIRIPTSAVKLSTSECKGKLLQCIRSATCSSQKLGRVSFVSSNVYTWFWYDTRCVLDRHRQNHSVINSSRQNLSCVTSVHQVELRDDDRDPDPFLSLGWIHPSKLPLAGNTNWHKTTPPHHNHARNCIIGSVWGSRCSPFSQVAQNPWHGPWRNKKKQKAPLKRGWG
jgi:hypothetical protein